MESSVVGVLDIGEAFIPCVSIIQVVHTQNLYDNHVDDHYMSIDLGMEIFRLGEIGVQYLLETEPKCIEETIVPISDDRLWDPQLYPD